MKKLEYFKKMKCFIYTSKQFVILFLVYYRCLFDRLKLLRPVILIHLELLMNKFQNNFCSISEEKLDSLSLLNLSVSCITTTSIYQQTKLENSFSV